MQVRFQLKCMCTLLAFTHLLATGLANPHLESGLMIESRQAIYSVDDQTPPPHNELHFPYLYEAADGTWYMTHREGPHYRAAKMFGVAWHDPKANYLTDDRVQTVMSTDRGKTWRPWPGLPHRERDLRLSVTRLSDGSLISYIFRFHNLSEDGSATTPILRSHDDGRTWTRKDARVTHLPFLAGSGGGLWGSIVEVAQNNETTRLLATCYADSSTSEDGKPRYGLGLLESSDQGASWQHVATIAGPDLPGEEGPTEADLVHLGRGELYTVFRTGDKEGSVMHQARSKDWGRTWTTPKQFPGGEEGVSPQLVQLSDNRLVICYGRRVDGDRALLAAVSTDGGRHWKQPLRIYEGSGKVYADPQVLEPDRFRVVYDESPVEQEDGSTTNQIVRVVLRATAAR